MRMDGEQVTGHDNEGRAAKARTDRPLLAATPAGIVVPLGRC